MSCFMIVATACRADERKFVGFFLLNVIRGHLKLGHELYLMKERNLPDRVFGYCFTGLVAGGLVLVLSEWLPNSVLFIP